MKAIGYYISQLITSLLGETTMLIILLIVIIIVLGVALFNKK